MYGSTDDEKEGGTSTKEQFPLVNKDNSVVDIAEQNKQFLKNPFEENFDGEFWSKVTDLYGDGEQGIGWTEAVNKVRVDKICARYALEKKDPLVALITERYDEFLKQVADPQVMSSFTQQLAMFTEILLNEDAQQKGVYAWTLPIPSQGKKTILHLCAERNLTDIAHLYVKKYPGCVYVPTSGHGLERLPLELALLGEFDDVASFLADNMLHERVRNIFESNDTFDARFKFADIVKNPGMKKTVVSILDCCVNADWPFMPIKEGEKKEEAWSKIPDMPLRYHFYFRLLDGDLNSEPAKTSDGIVNPEFDHRTPSCLQLLANSSHSQDIISHPVIRILVNKKWELFGRRKIRLHFLQYVIFLIFLTLAFHIDNKTTNYRTYTSTVDYIRAFSEIVTLLFTFVYVISEIDQMEKERLSYWFDPFNYLDLIGMICILAMIPLRYTDSSKAEWSVAVVAFLFNFLRVFKYFPAFKQIGLYSKTFAQIIYYDITKFALIYIIVMLAFTGSVFLSLKAAGNGTSSLSFWQIMLKEIRALTENNPFEDSYCSYSVGVITLLMLNMFVIIVILSNILIGQLSYRYETAIAEAGIQYSIDKTKFITKYENSRFLTMNVRIANYEDGGFVSDDTVVSELLGDWVTVRSKKSENSKTAVRSMIEKVLRTKEKED